MKASVKWKLVRIVVTMLNLFGAWMLFTGSLQMLSVVTGLVLSLLVSLLTFEIFIEETEVARRLFFPQIHFLLIFILFVIFRMYLSSFKVVFNLIRGHINPRIVHFRTRLTSDFGRVILAGGISLTPGTIVLFLDDDHLIVHWLDAATTHSAHSGEIVKGTMERLLQKAWI